MILKLYTALLPHLAMTSALLCKDSLDIFLVIDTNEEVGRVFGAYENELSWAQQLADGLLHGNNRMGILTFHDTVFSHSLTSDIGVFTQYIKDLKSCTGCQPQGMTASPIAIQTAQAELTSDSVHSKKIIVFLSASNPKMESVAFSDACGYNADCQTYGCDISFDPKTFRFVAKANDPTCLSKVASEAKEAGIEIYTVGVGEITSNIYFESLLRGDVASYNEYDEIETFGDLQNQCVQLSNEMNCETNRSPLLSGGKCICVCQEGYESVSDDLPCIKSTQAPPTSPPITTLPSLPPSPTLDPALGGLSCLKDALDVFIILDTSGSIAQEEGAYAKQLNFSKAIAEIVLGEPQNRVGILGFNDFVFPKYSLTASIEEMNSQIDYMASCRACQPHGRTATHLAIKEAQVEFQKTQTDSKKVIILLTDGQPYMSGETYNATCELPYS